MRAATNDDTTAPASGLGIASQHVSATGRGRFASLQLELPADDEGEVRADDGRMIDLTRLETCLGRDARAHFFHGSTAASLTAFLGPVAPYRTDALLSMGALQSKNLAAFGGELGNSLQPGAANRKHVSVVDFDEFVKSYDHATEHRAPWTENIPEELRQRAQEFDDAGNEETARAFRKLANVQSRLWNGMPDGGIARWLITANFPVIYAYKPPSTALPTKADDGHHLTRDNRIEVKDIEKIFVPDEHLADLKSHAQGRSLKEKLSGFSEFTA